MMRISLPEKTGGIFRLMTNIAKEWRSWQPNLPQNSVWLSGENDHGMLTTLERRAKGFRLT